MNMKIEVFAWLFPNSTKGKLPGTYKCISNDYWVSN